MQKKVSTLVGIIIILVVAVIFFGGVFAYQYFELTIDKPPKNHTSATTVFQFNRPFIVTGIPLSETNFAPIYTSSEVLEKSLVTIRARDFWSNACERGGNTADCQFKNEQMVRLETSVAESESASWHEKEIYLTDKSKKIEQYEGYQIEAISIDSQNKQATIVIRKSTQ